MRCAIICAFLTGCATTPPSPAPDPVTISEPADWMFHVEQPRQVTPYTADEWKRFHKGKV